jgi:hypothetical protein
MIDAEEITQEDVQDAFVAAFKRRVGPGKMDIAELANKTGIPVRTLKSYRDREALPGMVNNLRICVVLGPDFASEIMHPAGLGGVESIELQPLDGPATNTMLTQLVCVLTRALEDGQIDHLEKLDLAPLFLRASRACEAQGKACLDDNVTSIKGAAE